MNEIGIPQSKAKGENKSLAAKIVISVADENVIVVIGVIYITSCVLCIYGILLKLGYPGLGKSAAGIMTSRKVVVYCLRLSLSRKIGYEKGV